MRYTQVKREGVTVTDLHEGDRVRFVYEGVVESIDRDEITLASTEQNERHLLRERSLVSVEVPERPFLHPMNLTPAQHTVGTVLRVRFKSLGNSFLVAEKVYDNRWLVSGSSLNHTDVRLTEIFEIVKVIQIGPKYRTGD